MARFVLILAIALLAGCSLDRQGDSNTKFNLRLVIEHNISIAKRNAEREITVLELAGLPVTDEDLHFLNSIDSLVTIDLRHTLVTDAGLETLAQNKNYAEIVLGSPGVTREGVEKLRESLPDAYIMW